MSASLTPKEVHLHLTVEEFYKLRDFLGRNGLRTTQTIYDKLQAIGDRLPRRQHAPESECKICDAHRQHLTEMCPAHDASHRCESGKRDHCTCDWCF